MHEAEDSALVLLVLFSRHNPDHNNEKKPQGIALDAPDLLYLISRSC